MNREVIEVNSYRPTSDGAGVKLNRVFGGRQVHRFDPFLMLDEFRSDEAADYIGGFPSHPHRGFETVTYMLEGRMLHEDHLGNKGILADGDVQWMTAARGIIHSEMPQQVEGRMHGFQLWVNLPAAEKMKAPYYRDIPASDIPVRSYQGVDYKVVAGEVRIGGERMEGAVSGLSIRPLYVDLHFHQQQEAKIDVESGHTVLLYVYEGQAEIGDKATGVKSGQLALLSKEGAVHVRADAGTRLLVLAGKPLGEPIVQYGPFVMNTEEEIQQAIEDYRNGQLV